ncbi:hypothetical protein [Chromobacterium haemolyticum]|uniref:Uncharacterized protein n=1 Tax=Chromobacterium haemolyticum TaxID=394935 RepID=A0A1W0D1D0_9NEIS|nr:hypothetical protein [Chromobacterium haemolyticum]OQS40804.1 hypothetical protein B0T45_10535 [Chromobacterium haemolyticum]
MSLDEKMTTLIVKLNKLTSQKKIFWYVKEPPRTILRGTDDHIPLFMMAKYKDQYFAIYQHRYQDFSVEFENFYWSEKIVLAIIDIDGHVLWEVREETSALYDLFETVRRQISKIDSVIEDLLADDE